MHYELITKLVDWHWSNELRGKPNKIEQKNYINLEDFNLSSKLRIIIIKDYFGKNLQVVIMGIIKLNNIILKNC